MNKQQTFDYETFVFTKLFPELDRIQNQLYLIQILKILFYSSYLHFHLHVVSTDGLFLSDDPTKFIS